MTDQELLRESTFRELATHETRRQFFGSTGFSLGAAALASLMGQSQAAETSGV